MVWCHLRLEPYEGPEVKAVAGRACEPEEGKWGKKLIGRGVLSCATALQA